MVKRDGILHTNLEECSTDAVLKEESSVPQSDVTTSNPNGEIADRQVSFCATYQPRMLMDIA